MNLDFRKVAGFTAASFFLCVTFCCTSDTDDSLVNNEPAVVKINFKNEAYGAMASVRSLVAEKTTVVISY
ncbi:hypothetical protein CQS02_02875 [Elizabethkingia miricola]|nr:hypothetical protein CQS02_02875 [Elizabethkingia miricola]